MRLLRSPDIRRWLLTGAIFLCILGGGAALVHSAQAGSALEERKLPMKFSWVGCHPDCAGWVSAVGIVTADSPADFETFARGRELKGATLHTAQGDRTSVVPEAFCESMCVYLLLAGSMRYVPDAAHVRVHQIWMGDRADDAKAASYTAQDLMIVERDIGRLAKYTFDMGGAGDLLSLSLNVPPWEELHELSQTELRLTNLVTTDAVAELFPHDPPAATVAALTPKPVQDRLVNGATKVETRPQLRKSTRTAEVGAPTGGSAVVAEPAQ